MAVIPKSKTVQLRVEPELFDKFSVQADLNHTTVSAMIRGLMLAYIRQLENRSRKPPEHPPTLESSVKAPPAAIIVQSSPGASVRVPASLSERRKAEKLAKAARKAKE